MILFEYKTMINYGNCYYVVKKWMNEYLHCEKYFNLTILHVKCLTPLRFLNKTVTHNISRLKTKNLLRLWKCKTTCFITILIIKILVYNTNFQVKYIIHILSVNKMLTYNWIIHRWSSVFLGIHQKICCRTILD